MSSPSKNEDRLTNLPKELLSHILSSMPTKFAVQTSVLSKRWRYNWTLTTNLDFGDDPPPVHVVDRVLCLCKSFKIQRFRLCLSPSMQATSESKSNISRWINEAVRLNVCEVDLNIPPFELPLSLFTCKTLTKLSLSGWGMVNFIGPSVVDVVTLPLLKTLHITLPMNIPGFVSVNAFKLIHACPMLEDLSLQTACSYEQEHYAFNIPTLKRLKLNVIGYSSSNVVTLNVPNLEYFCFDGLLCSIFEVKDVSSLVEVTVRLSVSKPEGNFFLLYGFLVKAISTAKSISWSSPTLDVLQSCPLPKFPNLTYMKLEGLEGSRRFRSLLELFRHLESSSELEHLCFQEPEDSCWIEPESVPTWMLTNLKTMKITKCKGRKCDMQFIEYVLGNSEVFKKLTLLTCESLSKKDEKQLCARLLKCPRATSYCQIQFVGKWLSNVF